jgi:hypothetical protein
MSSMTWARLVLSPVMMHYVSSVTSCCRATWHCSDAKRVVHTAYMTL